jgi:hypothetical protein
MASEYVVPEGGVEKVPFIPYVAEKLSIPCFLNYGQLTTHSSKESQAVFEALCHAAGRLVEGSRRVLPLIRSVARSLPA